jgi:hypothetical protein
VSSDSRSVIAADVDRERSSATRSLSLATRPGSIPAAAASSAVLVRFPLWPRANPPSALSRYTGCALCHVDDPVVEYRVWPIARWPWRVVSL